MDPNESPSKFVYTRPSLTSIMTSHSYDGTSGQLPSTILTSLPDPQATLWQSGLAPTDPALNSWEGYTGMGDMYTPCRFSYGPDWPAAAHPSHGTTYDDYVEEFRPPPAGPHLFGPRLDPHNHPYQPQTLDLGTDDPSKRRYEPSPMSTSSDTPTIVPPNDNRGMTPDDGRLSVCSSVISVNHAQPGPTTSEVHRLCLLATQTYLKERRTNWRLRGGPPQREARHGHGDRACRPVSGDPSAPDTRWAPYVKRETPGPDARRRRCSSAASMTGVEPTKSLLANVSKISTALWKQAQRDRLYVPNAERMALDSMRQLLEWAETVMWREGEAGREDEDRDLMRVLTAGRNLCAWLGDEVGVEMIEAME